MYAMANQFEYILVHSTICIEPRGVVVTIINTLEFMPVLLVLSSLIDALAVGKMISIQHAKTCFVSLLDSAYAMLFMVGQRQHDGQETIRRAHNSQGKPRLIRQ